jgi:hypothetical protein
MSSIDSKNNVSNLNGLTPATIATNTTTAGEIIDTKGFESLSFLNRASDYTDGTYTPLIEDGEDSGLSDAAAVTDTFLIGTEANAALSADGVSKIGYIGKKRYVRLSYVSTSTTTGATLDSVAVLGDPIKAPVA